MYKKLGIEKTVNQLDGVFMFVLYDANTKTLLASRDPMGVRPGFLGIKNNEIFISSEAKPMMEFCDRITPFPPGSWWSSKNINNYNRYFYYESDRLDEFDENIICDKINILLTDAVKKKTDV